MRLSDEFARLFFFFCVHVRRRRRRGGNNGRRLVVAGFCALHRCIYKYVDFFFFRVSQDEVSTFLQRINSVEIFEVREFSFLDEMNLHFLTNILYFFASA